MKLQPNFSWQKYQGSPEDQREQFQYQLQAQHILVANSLNATVDDSSYFTRERQTAFTWIDSKPIYKKTLATVAWTSAGTTNLIPTGISGPFTTIKLEGYISSGGTTLTLPSAQTPPSNILMAVAATNIVLQSGGTNYSAYSGYVTIYYTKG